MTVRYRQERGAWYVDVVVNHLDGRKERIRARSPINLKRAAEEHERKLIAAALERAAKPPAPPERRVREFAEEFITTYASVNNKPSEVAAKKTNLRIHILPVFGDLMLSEVTAVRIDQLKAEKLAAGLSRKRVNNILATLHRMLVVAHKWGALAVVPQAGLLQLPPSTYDFLTFEEADRLLVAADVDWRTAILAGLRTGMRLGELRALRWEDVDLPGGKILVRQSAWKDQVGSPKTNRTRTIPTSAALLDALNAHRHLRGPLVFCQPDGAMLTKEQMKHPLWRACRRVQLRRIGWHVLRHSFASHLVMRGVPLKVVQEYLGHTTIQMTMRYAHLAPEVGRQAVDLLDGGAAEPGAMAPAWHQTDGKAVN